RQAGADLRPDGRAGVQRGRQPGPRLRPAGDGPAPARAGPRAADLPLRRPRLPADELPRVGRPGHPGLTTAWFTPARVLPHRASLAHPIALAGLSPSRARRSERQEVSPGLVQRAGVARARLTSTAQSS